MVCLIGADVNKISKWAINVLALRAEPQAARVCTRGHMSLFCMWLNYTKQYSECSHGSCTTFFRV
jgi:hypothetical protein